MQNRTIRRLATDRPKYKVTCDRRGRALRIVVVNQHYQTHPASVRHHQFKSLHIYVQYGDGIRNTLPSLKFAISCAYPTKREHY